MAGILVDLDSLQDTRFGVLTTHFPNVANALLDDQYTWLNREEDKVNGVDKDVFSVLYGGRANDPETVLGNSPPTAIPLIINRAIAEHTASADTQFYESRLKVHINAWPYKFTHEVKDVLCRTVYEWIKVGHIADIRVVDYSPEELSSKFIAESGYDILYMYDLKKWVEAQGESLVKFVIPAVTIVSPRIIRNRDEALLAEVPTKFKDRDMFETISEELRYIIGMDFIDLSYFSFIPIPTEAELEADMLRIEAIKAANTKKETL